MRKLILILDLILMLPALATVERRCYEAGPDLAWIQSVNTDAQSAARRLNESMSAGKITVATENTGPEVQFLARPVKVGDCVLTRTEEAGPLEIAGRGKVDLLPVVFLKASDGAKHFGYLETKLFAQLKLKPLKELSSQALTTFRGRHHDLTLLYVLCPADRESPCELSIRHRGKWLKKKFSVLAKGQHHRRIGSSGDTPQGIFHFWATMFESDVGFGGLPRIDLDASLPPLNAYPYEMYRYLLEEMVPESAFNDYWLNELPLAYRLGRVHLRLHGSQDPKRPTEGCINCGSQTAEILKTLARLGALSEDQTLPRKPSDPATLGWKVAPGLGKTFLIVKDVTTPLGGP